MSDPERPPVLFFDGLCNLCNGSVDLLLRLDRRHRLRFASLQGRTAERLLATQTGAEGSDRVDSMILWEAGRISICSTAVLRSLTLMGGVWRLAGVALLVPRPLRDLVYRFVARHRYAWFGRRDTCRVPTAAEAGQLLD